MFNAVDAMPDGGDVTLRTQPAPNGAQRRQVAIEVGDSGVGMDEETRRRCLEPFFTTKGERGTGLGWPWSTAWCSATAARSRSTARRARARRALTLRGRARKAPAEARAGGHGAPARACACS